jgi:transposase
VSAQGFRFVRAGGNCEGKRTVVGGQVAHAGIRCGSLRSKGPADFGSGEGYLGRMAVVKDGLSAQDRADDQIRQEKNCGDSQGDCMDEL